MIRLAADVAEIQGLADAQAKRQAPYTGIASQWSAAQSGMGPSPVGALTTAAPVAGMAGAAMAGGAMQQRRAAIPEVEEIEEVEAESLGAFDAAAVHAARGAQAGSMFGPLGILIGGLAGGVTGAAMGAADVEADYGDTVSNWASFGTQRYDYAENPDDVRSIGALGRWDR